MKRSSASAALRSSSVAFSRSGFGTSGSGLYVSMALLVSTTVTGTRLGGAAAAGTLESVAAPSAAAAAVAAAAAGLSFFFEPVPAALTRAAGVAAVEEDATAAGFAAPVLVAAALGGLTEKMSSISLAGRFFAAAINEQGVTGRRSGEAEEQVASLLEGGSGGGGERQASPPRLWLHGKGSGPLPAPCSHQVRSALSTTRDAGGEDLGGQTARPLAWSPSSSPDLPLAFCWARVVPSRASAATPPASPRLDAAHGLVAVAGSAPLAHL